MTPGSAMIAGSVAPLGCGGLDPSCQATRLHPPWKRRESGSLPMFRALTHSTGLLSLVAGLSSLSPSWVLTGGVMGAL